jgi:hypothetical protein
VIANQVNVESSNLRQRTVKGVSWSAVAQFVTQSFSWVISIIVARLLGPKAYGLIAMTAVFVALPYNPVISESAPPLSKGNPGEETSRHGILVQVISTIAVGMRQRLVLVR